VSEESVWKTYTDTKDRIEGTVAKRYGSMIILDSSANNRESIVEEYILNQASKDKKVYFRTFTRWEAVPDRFPEWQKTGEMFKVFKGDSSRPPCIIDETFNALPGDDRNMIDIPIDSLDSFKKNIYESLKLIAGVPVGESNIFFPNLAYVEPMFDDYLENIRTPITASVTEQSEDLIMNKIIHIFMKQDISGKWYLKRAKTAPRWVRVDLSEKDDYTGIAMCHPEIRDDGTIVCVFDFAFDVSPGKDGINLDAILSFVRFLYRKYHIHIAGVSTDKWQSSFIAQAIKKDDKNYSLISVDESKTPYLVFKSKVLNGSVKVGYYSNIMNNIKSLVETTKKIEHKQNRKSNEENKRIGLEAKDITDGMSGALYHMFSDIGKHPVTYNYDDINRSIDIVRQYEKSELEDMSNIDKSHLLNNLMKKVMKRDMKTNVEIL
jgi:hypothetical protein